jgi:hypothetical protein
MSDSAALSTNNFKYIKNDVRGSSQATYVLGFGGMGKYALVAEAKENMLSKIQLKDNQAIVNTTVNFKNSFFFGFIVVTTNCIVSADVVEFTSNNIEPISSSKNLNNSNSNIPIQITNASLKSNITFDQSIADQLSGDEKLIYLSSTKENLNLVSYDNINSVKHADIVSFMDRFGNTQFGIVSYIFLQEGKIGITYYNSEHISGLISLLPTDIKKLE